MEIVVIPLNDDNYGYLLIDERTKAAAIVDVSNQPDKIIKVVNDHQVDLRFVLSTHKHLDHAGGNHQIKAHFPGKIFSSLKWLFLIWIEAVDIYGSEVDNVEACTGYVSDGQEIRLGDIKILCLSTPGHTLGHICYFATSGVHNAVFTGDTLFRGGCGKFFEGTACDMRYSLNKLAVLPPDTEVYCGHEYTLSNYRFAISVDPSNLALQQAKTEVEFLLSEGKFSVPSTISGELQTNPFLRVDSPGIRSNVSDSDYELDSIAVLGLLREKKNNFK
jgi:hydroxyacylglutathione hydrolase